MRKVALFLLTVILALAIVPAYAHSGRTDGKGGHYNRSTGEYHYHHGYPAHSHTNGICPYENKDAETTKANVYTTKSSYSVSNTSPKSSSPKITTEWVWSWKVFGKWIGFFLIAFLVVMFIVLTILDIRSDSCAKKSLSVSSVFEDTEKNTVMENRKLEQQKAYCDNTIDESLNNECSMFWIVVFSAILSAFAYFVVYRVLNVYDFREMAIACACVWCITIIFALVKRNKMRKTMRVLLNDARNYSMELSNAMYKARYYKDEAEKANNRSKELEERLRQVGGSTEGNPEEKYAEQVQEITYKYEVERNAADSLREELSRSRNEMSRLKSDAKEELEKRCKEIESVRSSALKLESDMKNLREENGTLKREIAYLQHEKLSNQYAPSHQLSDPVPHKYCPVCGLRNADDAELCRECEHDFKEDTNVIRTPADVTSFSHWLDSKYDTPYQKTRRKSAKKVGVLDYDPVTQKACVESENGYDQYTTTYRYCTCWDFRMRELPCKHMYAVMMDLGFIPKE